MKNDDKLNDNKLKNPEKFNDFSIKEIYSMIDDNEDLDLDTRYLMNYVVELEKVITDLKSNLFQSKQNELTRISKEFLVNDYERRFGVGIEKIISAIVGNDNSMSEMKRILKERKNYYQSLELCRNYNIFQNKYEKIYNSLFKKD